MRVPGSGSVAAPSASWPGALGAASGFGWRRALIGLVVLGGSSVLGYQLYQRTLGTEQAPPPAVQTAAAGRRSLVDSVTLPGTVTAARLSQLSFAASGSGQSVSGTVKSISVRTGDVVKAGQQLASLDTTALDLAVQSAQASLNIAQIKFGVLLAGSLPPEVASAAQNVVSAQGSLGTAEANLATLRNGGADASRTTAAQAVLSAQNALTTAQQTLDTAQARVDQNVQYETVGQTLDAMNAQLTKAKADLQAAAGAPATSFNAGSMALSAANDAADILRERCALLSARDTCANLAVSATDGLSLLNAIDQGTLGPRRMSGVIANYSTIVPAAGVAMQDAAFRYIQATAATPGLAARANSIALSVWPGNGIPLADALANALRARDAAHATLDAARANQAALLAGQPASLQNALNTVESARASLATAAANRDQVVGGALPSDIQQQQQSVVQSQLSLRTAQNNRDGAALVAPYDALVGAITMTVGQASGNGQIVLVDPLSFQLAAAVQEADVVRLRTGQTVSLTFDALAGTTLQGRVISIAPTADIQQGVASYAVVISIPPRTGAASNVDLRTGMAGTAAVEISRRDNALTVPARAIKRQGRDQTVAVLVNGQRETRIVRIGVTDGTFTEITGGLNDGDLVVTGTTTTAASTAPATTGAGGGGPGGGGPGGGGPGGGGPGGGLPGGVPVGPPVGGPGR